jgi:hypothetical protein
VLRYLDRVRVAPEMTNRDERIARNEALFRSVNERVRALVESSAQSDRDPVAFVCECGREDCAESVELTLGDYERVRSDSSLFMVVPGHEIADVEDVVERPSDRYVIVRKHEEEAEVALETDPRA